MDFGPRCSKLRPMRCALLFSATILSLATAASATPPREESPAPKALLTPGQGSSDAELAREEAAANAFPLGTLKNPIRVGGPEGERAYLARLRCADGRAPKVGAKREGGVGAFGSVTDAVTLDCGAAAPGKAELILDIYNEEHVENRAPAGFTIAQP